jgi:hypothetical protein
MCDIYVDDVGYVCYECQNEFKTYLESNYPDEEFTEGQMKVKLKDFMKSEKDTYVEGEVVSVSEFFSSRRR